ncbi:hypothetical protein ACI780_06810 [Geodermatophilus sp. SYSU D00814]
MGSAAMTAAIRALEEALERLRPAPASERVAAVPRDGRYEGGDGQLVVELRVDSAGAAVLSGDVYRASNQGPQYVASLRTAPGTRYTGTDQRWPAVWQDSAGEVVTGSVQLRAGPDGLDGGLATLRLDKRLNGLPPHADLVVVVRRAGAELRRIGLELEREEGVQLPAAVPLGGVPMSIPEALRRSGFVVHDVGMPTTVPARPEGWNLSTTMTVLDDLMTRTAQAALTAPAWELHLLMLGRSTRSRLLGVMFDSADVLPRQGAAVFVDAIRDVVPPAEQDRKIIQTAVHELGHALNLTHRFERQVGRADSTSFMNYDWRYRGGNRRDEFWRRFAFAFDADELEFLRHAPRAALQPGRAPFHSVNYWADGTGGYSPYFPELPLPGFDLTLAPPTAGPVFAFGQPVFLQVTLRNNTSQAAQLPPEVLDPKAGFLELLVRRVTGRTGTPLAQAQPFVPIMQRCFDVDASAPDALPPGQSLRNNVNLTFGSGGFTFAEPGEFGITPLLSFIVERGPDQYEDLVIRGPELRIRIAHPHDLDEERDALILLRPDVGAWFAMGGSDFLAAAGESLEEVRVRRSAAGRAEDGVVAAIVRAAGIHAERPSVRFVEGRFVERPGDPELAGEVLGGLTPHALQTFDAHTAQHTRSLAERLQAARQ